MNTARTIAATCALALVLTSCTTGGTPAVTTTTTTAAPSPVYGEECDAFAPDPSDSFYAFGVTYHDADPLEWESADPAEVGMDQAMLDAAADNVALSGDVASMLVVSDGKLIFERYFNASSASEANNVHSLSKSILSLLTGIAIEDGLLSLDTKIDDVLSTDLVGEHGDLTVENLLTMSGGLLLDDQYGEYWYDDTPSDEPGEPSFVRAVLERPNCR